MPTVERLVERVPPHSLDTEMAVLGSMLMDDEAVPVALEMLQASSFYRDAHRKVFEAMTGLFNSQKPVDLVTLSEELKATGKLEEVGGADYLASLTSVVPTASNVQHYAKIVREKAMLRSLISAATQIVGRCYEDQDDADALLDRAEQLLFEIANRSLGAQAEPLKGMLSRTMETIERLYQRKEMVTGLATGMHDLDVMTAGLQPADLIIVAGRPSMGKSSLATCIAEHVAVVERTPVAIFSLEMSKDQLAHRMLCALARVNVHNARTGFLAQADWKELPKAASKLDQAAPILIDDSPSLSALELRAKARRLKNQHRIGLIIVDYLQMMRGSFRVENRQQEISEISRSLKALAKELNVPVIAVSQLSRGPEQREDRRPQLSDLRESGAIEQDADVVMLLFREEVYHPTDENRGKAELIVAKQRNGPVGSVQLAFLREFTRFENLSPRSS